MTNELTSLVTDYCFGTIVDGACLDVGGDDIGFETTRIALFAGDTQDWFWNYDNNDLKLLQLRFYEIN